MTVLIHNKILILLFLIIIFSLTGCDTEKRETMFPRIQNSNSKILFDRYEQKVFTYDTELKNVVEKTNIDNFLIYEFPMQSKYYTAGHSENNQFKIIKIEDNSIEIVKEMDKNTGLFPLAISGDPHTLFFMQEEYDKNPKEGRIVVLYNEESKDMEEFPATIGLISKGAVKDGILYYSSYMENTDTYNIYYLDYKNTKIPELLKINVSSEDIFVFQNELIFCDKEEIQIGEKIYNKGVLNYIEDGLFIKYIIDENMDLNIKVLDIKQDKVILWENNILDFEIKNNKFIAYCLGGIKEVVLN